MRALVLGGAGNFGALQAGAVEVLLETGFRPELIVGTSAGALNGLLLASEPTPEGARRAQAAWQQVSLREIGTPGLLESVRRLVTNRDSLVPSIPLARFVARSLGMDLETFGQLEARCGVRARAMAVCVETGKLVAFGDRDDDRLIDGAMSSTAIPPFLPPWRAGGRRYLDGGVLSKLPLLAAIQRGATQILAVNVLDMLGGPETARGMRGIASYAISLGIEGMTEREVDLARHAGIELHLLELQTPSEVAFWDFSHAERLIAAGRQQALSWLEATPLRLRAPWQAAARMCLAGIGRRLERLAGG
jgi:predicted acylesterase/phospholipase RssA